MVELVALFGKLQDAEDTHLQEAGKVQEEATRADCLLLPRQFHVRELRSQLVGQSTERRW
jgi:hypothetical protein